MVGTAGLTGWITLLLGPAVCLLQVHGATPDHVCVRQLFVSVCRDFVLIVNVALVASLSGVFLLLAFLFADLVLVVGDCLLEVGVVGNALLRGCRLHNKV